ncbi:NADH dehydrogenase [ubiquinone] 1 beta subcomplex subunit 8, mitochondrial-like [Dreissena polymorpha]|uniref:NADH dehydrogenase [ubiquinone] 1 beta subcomplex subunit 8, mitochondrial n=1 Tax=Dreissena polymorpha TaxID=45954 RepID=A0A9D4CLX9_DREPO|nr:NADH dehydrogenase [ubiquinone] 1 beta subcomplex subunit 8, mitochondrial-like [Dreissena polymorpha]KAH3726803.1 hypothetical protein DPMN_052673 [Dreissena polymorpha]
MAALRRSWLLVNALKNKHALHLREISSTQSLLAGAYHPDWKPGDYPQTQKEYEEAAKKYNLLPEDYRPLPDDGYGAGDYPALPNIGEEQKSPWTDWDDPRMRRNWGDPVHIDFDILVPDRADPAKRYRYPLWSMYAMFLFVYSMFFFTWLLSMRYPKVMPMMDKVYPYEEYKVRTAWAEGGVIIPPTNKRLKHYTFEPLD